MRRYRDVTGSEWESQKGFYGVRDCLNTNRGKGQEGREQQRKGIYLKYGTPEKANGSLTQMLTSDREQ